MPLSQNATKVRNELIQAAKYNKHVEYLMLSYLIGLNSEDKAAINPLLKEISIAEHKEGKPILWPLVINKETNLPADGYFKLLYELDKSKIDDDREKVYQEGLNEALNYWSRRKRTGKSGARKKI